MNIFVSLLFVFVIIMAYSFVGASPARQHSSTSAILKRPAQQSGSIKNHHSGKGEITAADRHHPAKFAQGLGGQQAPGHTGAYISGAGCACAFGNGDHHESGYEAEEDEYEGEEEMDDGFRHPRHHHKQHSGKGAITAGRHHPTKFAQGGGHGSPVASQKDGYVNGVGCVCSFGSGNHNGQANPGLEEEEEYDGEEMDDGSVGFKNPQHHHKTTKAATTAAATATE